jgi:hypothetical protein
MRRAKLYLLPDSALLVRFSRDSLHLRQQQQQWRKLPRWNSQGSLRTKMSGRGEFPTETN